MPAQQCNEYTIINKKKRNYYEDLAGKSMPLAEPILINKYPAGTYWGTALGRPTTMR